ncbi:MAG: hypothetical protein KBT03_07635 [Bacteroidales bacterium]|nr:hypothetical protein [Candidatus Scybalousia scybalohippi]
MKRRDYDIVTIVLEREIEYEIEYQKGENEPDLAYLKELLHAYKETLKRLYKGNMLLVIGSINRYIDEYSRLEAAKTD